MAKIAIIGGGAAGLTASINAAKNNQVTIFERNSICGKKITITGNGKCNYWNENQDISNYHSDDPEQLNNFFDDRIFQETKAFFKKIGLIPFIKDGYYYPYSKQAISVRNALERTALKCGVEIKKDFLVTDIIKKEDSFFINPQNENLKFDKVIITSGSKCAPKTGSDGLGYQLAASFSHKIIKPRPALVQLVSDANFLKRWAKIRCEALVKLYNENKELTKDRGEIQLTDYGVSGICVFNISYLVPKLLEKKQNIFLHINFLPFLSQKTFEEIFTFFNDRSQEFSRNTLDEMLEELIPYQLVDVLLKEAKIKKELTWQKLNYNDQKRLILTLTDFSLKIVDTLTFNEAQCASGGVSLKEIDMKTMESKKVKNLYFAGEILDVNGNCGGYNLGFAFMSGIKAGKSC